MKGQISNSSQRNVAALISRSQALGVQWIQNCQEFQNKDAYYKRNPQWGHRGPPRGRYPYFYGRARGGRQPSKVSPVEKVNGATPSVHSRIEFPTDGQTYPKGVRSPLKLDKGKAVVAASDGDKDKVAGLDEEYFEERKDEMVSTVSIIPTEYLGEYIGNPVDDYDVDDKEVFLVLSNFRGFKCEASLSTTQYFSDWVGLFSISSGSKTFSIWQENKTSRIIREEPGIRVKSSEYQKVENSGSFD
ncbi:hypothetical protein Ahy_B02g059026 isoform B [Arachis hypogaea]|uniref:Uncharacterized protein n=1 Tax=Arachis hypogaea TaxID=3818 RepID=A0A445AFW8_ARAHY|nr:hypothetical protein Ahy_B02g059026 isoform B [Arachis hypogaea]